MRDARRKDIPVWAAMRARLWPDADAAELTEELPAMLGDPALCNLVLLDAADRVIGFAEVQLRTMFDGCPVAPYPHIEGIWVDSHIRREGGARTLLAAIEARARRDGHDRIGSDVELDNIGSQAWHMACGFEEEARSILYSKPL
ncbi:MAG: GNAT family N-acetyltransferase [Sphingopyxis sp.]|nr:GNAT family N-acetyltransferase [Sphingopyxis sp.]